MPAGGFRTFVAGEVLDEDDINDYLMQGVLVFGGSAVRGTAIPSPVEGQVSFLTDSDTIEFYDGSDWIVLETTPSSPTATGGVETTSGGFKYHTFTSSGTLTVTDPGVVDVLIISSTFGHRPSPLLMAWAPRATHDLLSPSRPGDTRPTLDGLCGRVGASGRPLNGPCNKGCGSIVSPHLRERRTSK
jgi:hypothetical protein